MQKIDIKDLKKDYAKFADKIIVLAGWVKSVRDMKNFGFIDMGDGTSFKGAQIVISAEKLANYDKLAHLNTGSTIIVNGKVVLTPQMKQTF